jgi:multiple sugar transport system permease protein
MATTLDTTKSARPIAGVQAYTAKRSGRKTRTIVSQVVLYVVAILLAVIFLFPFYLLVRNALLTQAQISALEWSWWPSDAQWANLKTLFNDYPMATGIRNSAIIAVVNLVFQTLFASMAAYGLARMPVRGKDVVFYIILLTLMIPSAVTFVPTYVVIAKLGWINTVQGIVVPGLFSAFAVFIFRQFYLDFPKELEDAGRLDGLSYFGVFRALVLPNSWGVMAAIGALSFINSWNAFLWPLVVGQSPDSYTIQIVLSTLITAQVINLPVMFMGAIVAIAPLVLIFLILQRYIVQGVTMSGIKG